MKQKDMEFNPLVDYSNFDLNDEQNLTYWKFGELIKTLITLTTDGYRQVEIIGEIGIVTEEMAIDLDNYFTVSGQAYLKHNLLTIEQYDKINMLNTFFSEKSGEKCSAFWDVEELPNSADWQNVREQAKLILCLLKMDNLDLKIDRKKEYKIINGVKHLTGESTKLLIIQKKTKIN